MTTEAFYKNITALDRVQHRALRLRTDVNSLHRSKNMNAVFITAVEFPDVCREYPIVYVRAGKDEQTGEELVAPMAVLGLTREENLYLQPDNTWRAGYVPAFFRRFPFLMGRADNANLLLCVDREWEGLSETQGEPLFQPNGEPTPLLLDAQKFAESYEQEVHRTRLFCGELSQAGLLQDMRFDATTPDGQALAVEGFLAIDEKKLAELPEAKIVEWHRNGMLGLIHAQQISMGLMRRLVEWRLLRLQAAA
jgi:hypothetical protein